MRDTQVEVNKDVLVVGRVDCMPILLQMLCEATGLGFAVVARVTDTTWTACAVRDTINFGVKIGGQVDLKTTFCCEVRADLVPVVMDHASADPRFRDHPTPKLYGFESYVSVPIVLACGDYFGNLCALDRRPMSVSDPKTVALFTGLAQLIARQIDAEARVAELAVPSTRGAAAPAAAAKPLTSAPPTAALAPAGPPAPAVSAVSTPPAAMLTPSGPVTPKLQEALGALVDVGLRSPVQAILADAQALAQRAWDAGSPEIVGRITLQAERLSHLLDDMQDFARGASADGIRVHLRMVRDLEDLFARVVAELVAAHPGRTLISHVQVEGAVYCDPERVRQLTCRLLGNALAHGSADGPVSLIVRVEQAQLVIEVWNDGDPIAKHRLKTLFQPFWAQAGVAARREIVLGLYLCALIVAAHGGQIAVTSTRALGTQFVARLPIDAR